MLTALKEFSGDPELRTFISADQHSLGTYWGELSDLRNGLHHHGMRKEDAFGDKFKAQMERVCDFWTNKLRSLPAISLECGGTRHRRLLVSPIGERPGVLFSAVKGASSDGVTPDLCLIICSDRTELMIGHALSRSSFSGDHQVLRLDNPYGGIDERDRLRKRSRLALAAADEVFVNITGGTTLMGVVAEDLAQEARKLARPVRRFALIDHRSPEAQKQDPFVQGEILWLDNEERDGDY